MTVKKICKIFLNNRGLKDAPLLKLNIMFHPKDYIVQEDSGEVIAVISMVHPTDTVDFNERLEEALRDHFDTDVIKFELDFPIYPHDSISLSVGVYSHGYGSYDVEVTIKRVFIY